MNYRFNGKQATLALGFTQMFRLQQRESVVTKPDNYWLMAVTRAKQKGQKRTN